MKEKAAVEVKVGQVWKERDPRASRYFLVEAIEAGAPYAYDRAVVKTCLPDGRRVDRTRSTRIRLDRFNSHGSRVFPLVSGPN